MYLLSYKELEAADGCITHKSHTGMIFSADTNTKVSEVWKMSVKILIDRNLLWMELLISQLRM
jgi:hypothetical protein